MRVILKSGGKQYATEAGAVLFLEKLNKEVGEQVVLEDVLFATDGSKTIVGSPNLENSKIVAEVLENGKGPKTINFKKRRRKDSKRKKGHRQFFSKVKVLEVHCDGEIFKAPKVEKIVAKKAEDKETLLTTELALEASATDAATRPAAKKVRIVKADKSTSTPEQGEKTATASPTLAAEAKGAESSKQDAASSNEDAKSSNEDKKD